MENEIGFDMFSEGLEKIWKSGDILTLFIFQVSLFNYFSFISIFMILYCA